MTAMILSHFQDVPEPTGQPARPGPRRWTESEFDHLVQLGMFEGEQVELINGELLEVGPMNDPHAQAIRLAQYALMSVFSATEFTVSVQCPMRLPSGSRPLPDLVVVPGTPRDVTQHPTSAVLLVEVSESTLEFDQGEKAELYARNGIEEYWIVNLVARTLEVRRQPAQTASGKFAYRSIQSYFAEDRIAPLGKPGVQVRVADLLPTLEQKAK